MYGPVQIDKDLLLAHGDWMRALARHLCHGVDADDLVQDALVAATHAPPSLGLPVRPWLAQVLRNAWRTRARTHARRRRREADYDRHARAQPAPTADEVLERAELHRSIAELLVDLAEPYRTTLLLRFYEGQDAPTIARRDGVPAGTVRWRISEGLRRLRARLDERDAGGRRPWRTILMPLAGARAEPSAATLPASRGTLFTSGLIVLAGAAGVTAVTALPSARAPAPTPARVPAVSTSENHNLERKDPAVNHPSIDRAAAFLGAALPILVAASQADARPSLLDEGTTMCVAMRERVFECKDAFADAFAAAAGTGKPEQRKAVRAKAMEEIIADGSGPRAPREARCRRMIEHKLGQATGDEAEKQAKLDGMKKLLAFCSAKADCKERVECMLPFFPPGGGRDVEK